MTHSKVQSPADAGLDEARPESAAVLIAERLDDVEAKIDVVSEDMERLADSAMRMAAAHERIASALEQIADELKQPFRFSLVPHNWRAYALKGLRVAIYAAIYGTIVAAVGYAAAQVLPELVQKVMVFVANWQATH